MTQLDALNCGESGSSSSSSSSTTSGTGACIGNTGTEPNTSQTIMKTYHHQHHHLEEIMDDENGPSPKTNQLNTQSPMNFRSKIPSLSPIITHKKILPKSKSFTVYQNVSGAHAHGLGADESQSPKSTKITINLESITSWNEILLELNSYLPFYRRVEQVFNLNGQLLTSTRQLLEPENQSLVVACQGEPFKFQLPLPQTNLTSTPKTISKSVQLRHSRSSGITNPNINASSPFSVRKSGRSALSRSVFLGDSSPSIQQEIPGNISPGGLLKTFSEQNVSKSNELNNGLMQLLENSTTSLTDTYHTYNNQLQTGTPPLLRQSKNPNSARTPNHHKPRPLSCYSYSTTSGITRSTPEERFSVSKIPIRIQRNSTSTTTNSQSSQCQQSSSPPGDSVQILSSTKHQIITNIPSVVPAKTKQNDRDFVRPRLVTVIRGGMKPRKVTRYLLNQRTARSFDQVLSDLTIKIKPDWGAIRRVYMLSGSEVVGLEGFFGTERIFLVCPNDRVGLEDFQLDSDEVKAIQPYHKVPEHLITKSAKGIGPLEFGKSPRRVQARKPQPQQRTPPTSYPTHPKYIPVSKYPSFILSKFLVEDLIGDGNFACVRKCIERARGLKYALKVIDKTKSGKEVVPDQEVKILNSIKHPNIIELYEQYEHKSEMFMVMEFVPGGDLFDTIAEYTKFSEEESACMIRDISSALVFLHDRQIVHRDIKPENLLVYFELDGQRRLKLGDFGLAQIIEDRNPLYTICGTPTYVAPEILSETGYGLKVDIWALGIILYILLCGYPPFVSPTGEQEDLFDLILIGDYEFPAEQWDEISEDGKDLIMRMIESDVDIRLDAEEVLDHPWLATDAEECEIKRNRFFKKDFKSNVFQQMGLTQFNIPPFSGGGKFGTSNSS